MTIVNLAINRIYKNKILRLFCLLSLISLIAILAPRQASALTPNMRNFSAGNIMSDYIMADRNTMNEAQIQAFLRSKNSCNDTNLGRLTNYNSTYGYLDSRGKRYQYHLKNGHFVCMADQDFNGESAAHIIYRAAQDYRINPRVLIVLLQKEQGLVTDTWPNYNYQYAAATGYDCPDHGNGCDNTNAGFKTQVRKAANLFREVQDNRDYDGDGLISTYPVGVNYIQYNPNAGCGGSNVRILNRATSALYRYTPYQPNHATRSVGLGVDVHCGAYGNKNFWWYFTDWFGSTLGYVYKGVSYAQVFDSNYYVSHYSDLSRVYGSNPEASFGHFIANGMKEGRQASANFNVTSYKNRYPDLRWAFGNNLAQYYRHFSATGDKVGRIATGKVTLQPVSSYRGVDYSSIYSFNSYISRYSDINRVYGNSDTGALLHFINSGMREGRQASSSFSVASYRNRYPDLRRAFGNNLRSYYLHYIRSGQREGRTATGTYYGGTSVYKGVDYSAVYQFNTYTTTYSDIRRAFGLNDEATLKHFINSGMKEGRQASANFNVHIYKARYPDLRRAFGNNLKSYYLHYIRSGQREGRTAT